MFNIRKYFSTQISEGLAHISLFILRLFSGGLMLTHGIPKMERVLNGNLKFGDPIGLGPELSLLLAVLAEVGGSVLVILGLFTRFGAFLLTVTMFVAAFIQHAEDPIGKKELALLYLAFNLVILIMGAGKYSIDRKID